MADIAYNQQTSALLISIVGLQQVWGVDFNTAVERGHQAISQFLTQHAGRNTVDRQAIEYLMASVAPNATNRPG